tara:strand:- start:256 stop:1356 length:1101 start_codon:yes stop_codon:yes gene_type:complete
MSTVWLIDLESVETRYTKEWKTYLPKLLKKHGHTVNVVEGPKDIPNATTPGAFLNFGGTNIYKAKQVELISRAFTSGAVKDGDHFLFTDAWHPGIINLKYMAELLGVKIITHALWHAGSYDPEDFLGRLIGNSPWVRNAEKSFFHAYDHNYFASEFHVRLFFDELLNDGRKEHNPLYEETWKARYDNGKIVRCGWPMSYVKDELTPYVGMEKKNIILFPHRVAPEKQPEIFRDLKESLTQYEFVIAMERNLQKKEYYNLLGESKLVFSANLQETLGISWYEGSVVGTLPMVPDRLSYSEMENTGKFLYPSEWTESFDSYKNNKDKVIERIVDYMENYDKHLVNLNKLTNHLNENYFSCNNLLERLQ